MPSESKHTANGPRPKRPSKPELDAKIGAINVEITGYQDQIKALKADCDAIFEGSKSSMVIPLIFSQ